MQTLSVRCNCCIKLSKHHKKSRNNIKFKPFIGQYNWKEIDFPSHEKDWKKFESNNKSIAFNILHILYNNKEIKHVYKSKYNLKHENQVILLMITNGKK